MITLSLPRSDACNLAILNCALCSPHGCCVVLAVSECNTAKCSFSAQKFGGRPTQNRRQEVFTRGGFTFVWGDFAFVPGGLDIEKLIKPPMIYSVSYFDLGGLVLCLEAKPPW